MNTQDVLRSMLREMGIQVECGRDGDAPSRRPKEPRVVRPLRRGVPYTPQVFTPEEGGVPLRP